MKPVWEAICELLFSLLILVIVVGGVIFAYCAWAIVLRWLFGKP